MLTLTMSKRPCMGRLRVVLISERNKEVQKGRRGPEHRFPKYLNLKNVFKYFVTYFF